jgi:hypothetical protein
MFINMRARAATILCICTLFVGVQAWAERPPLASDLPLIDRPWTNDAEKFSFVILGDKTSGGEGKWPIYDRAVDAINLLDPDFVITVGDMIPGHMEERALWDAEWAEYMEHARRIESPLFFTVGNHDIANLACYQYWQEDFGRTYYSFDYKDCHFVVLNTEEERHDGRGPMWERMMQWAEVDLKDASDARHTFLFFHKPMWDDPRFKGDWARVEEALGNRPFTAVAGHVHYHSALRRSGNLYVTQATTGGGIRLSDANAWGGFHGFGFVTVDGDDVSYAVIQAEGGVWPVDIAPASFRKAVSHDLVTVDALPGTDLQGDEALVQNSVSMQNVLDRDVTIRVSIGPLSATGWSPVQDDDTPWKIEDDAVEIEQALAPGATAVVRIAFEVPAGRLALPPGMGWSVQYGEAQLEKYRANMIEVPTVPILPVSTYRAPDRVQVVGPFSLGHIDASKVRTNPAAANANFYTRLGPEDGFDAEQTYGDGLVWKEVATLPNGLINGNALMGTVDHAAAYVFCAVYSPHPQRTHAVVYADNYNQTYLNGALIEDAQGFAAPGGFVYPMLDLKAGWNSVVVKLINNRADWFLRLLIADPENNLRLTARLD